MEGAVRLNPRLPSIYRLVRGATYYALGDLLGTHGHARQSVVLLKGLAGAEDATVIPGQPFHRDVVRTGPVEFCLS